MEYYGDKQHVATLRQQLAKMINDFLDSPDANFLCIYGGRDVGKTYTTQKETFGRCIKSGQEIAVLYPQKGQINDGVLQGHWQKMIRNEFPNLKAKYSNDTIEAPGAKGKPATICRALWLGAAKTNKLNTMPNTAVIFVDEMFNDELSPGAIQKVITRILTYYETTDRLEDRVKVICMGNIENPADPIFDFFNVPVMYRKDEYEGLITRSLNRIAWHIPRPADIDEQAGTQSKFAQMIRGTNYGNVSEGKFRSDYGRIIQTPPAEATADRFFVIMLESGCYMAIATASDGYTYIESVNEDVYNEAPRRYVTAYQYTTAESVLLPQTVRDYIAKKAARGRLKFVDIESAIQLAPRIATKLRLSLI